MRQYLDLLDKVMREGTDRPDRTGTGTRGIFGAEMRFDLSEGFPLITTKKVFLKGIIHELIWFLQGSTNIKYLVDNGVNIWNEWPFQKYLTASGLADKYPKYTDEWKQKLNEYVAAVKTDEDFAKQWGELGPVYGKQWVKWRSPDGREINQIQQAIDRIKSKPFDRRIIVNAWNAGEIEQMALPPCHMFFQFYVADGKLSLLMYQRSCDMFLGVPFNIASYAILTMMMAQVTGLEPGEFVHVLGDTHIYHNHFEQVREQLTREPRPLPAMKINPAVRDIFAFKYEDFELEGYNPHPAIKAPISV